MYKYNYYPFKNKLENIDGEDLLKLKGITESWFIDYKSKSLKVADYAKHISAFANQYGGWLVIGIEEGIDKNRYAENFCGICSNDVNKISEDIRNSVTVHMEPTVLYEEKVIHGPIDIIGLERDKSIIIIGIPQSSNTPHIHSSGRIYRRTGDQSFPKPETDRYLLDELWKRNNEKHKREESFFSIIPDLPEHQKNTPWVFIYLKPSSFQKRADSIINFDEFVDVMKSTSDGEYSIEMDNIYSFEGGFVARHVFGNPHANNILTFRWWLNGTARLEIPLNRYNYATLSALQNGYKTIDEFLLKIFKSSLEDADMLDCNSLLNIIYSLILKYLQLTAIKNDKRDLLVNFHLINLGYNIPYFDSKVYLDKIDEYSFPIILDNLISVPTKPNESNMFTLKRDVASFDTQLYPILFSIPLIVRLFESLGVSYDMDSLLSILGLKPDKKLENNDVTLEKTDDKMEQ